MRLTSARITRSDIARRASGEHAYASERERECLIFVDDAFGARRTPPPPPNSARPGRQHARPPTELPWTAPTGRPALGAPLLRLPLGR